MLKRASFSLTMSAALLASGPLSAAPDGNVTYQMKKGDTLYELADDFFVSRAGVSSVLKINKIKDSRRIAIGKSILIPRRFLKYKPVDLRIGSVSGSVVLSRNGRNLPSKIGQRLVEGDEIQTGRNGFISVVGYGNSRLSLPSNSKARFIDARRYSINDLVDIQVKVLEGRGEVVAPKLRGEERYRIGTPAAVTAVRGTKFRVGYQAEDGLGLTEVVEGNVNVANGGRTVPAGQGFGVTASSEGVNDVEELLPAPSINTPGKLQTEETLKFDIIPLADAKGYRTQLSPDAGFSKLVGEAVTEGTNVTFDGITDGRYFIRSRAIAQSGLEGLSKVTSFRRKRLGVSAQATKSEFDDAFKFSWNLIGEGQSLASFQLWEKGKRDQMRFDEVGLSVDEISVSNLPKGTYIWRVAVFQIDQGKAIKIWGPNQELSVVD